MWTALCCRNRQNRSLLKSRDLWRQKCKTFTWWSTNIVWVGCRMRLFLACAAICLAQVHFGEVSSAQDIDIRVPSVVVAGNQANISTGGSGKATFYLVGPGVSRKSDVILGKEVFLSAQDLSIAGRYLAVLCSSSCRSAAFYVSSAQPHTLAFLVHPSRVAVAQNDAVSGVALPFDHFDNLVLSPLGVNLQLTGGGRLLFSQALRTRDGIAWFRSSSGSSAGALQVTASLDNVSAQRAVQEVASDPCNLRINGQRTPTGVLVQTEPVHDCAGNAVPDGTIVTFSATDSSGKSTVDAPIKHGIARAEMATSGVTLITAASGVVMGNELRLGSQ
jgi:hypothetical protein